MGLCSRRFPDAAPSLGVPQGVPEPQELGTAVPQGLPYGTPLPMGSARIALVASLAALLTLPAESRVVAERRWDWPIAEPHTVMRKFQRPPATWRAGHRGVDIAARVGTPIHAAADGIVAFAGLVAAKGVISLDHGLVRTTYEPVVPLVRRGQQVTKGEVIATVAPGWSHCAPAGVPICLHWGARRGRIYLDPLALLTRHARLLPER